MHACNKQLTLICDWLWENPPVAHKDKYLEIRNSIIQSVISREGLKLHAYNSLQIYSYLIVTRCIKNSNLRREVGIAIKSKETSSQFESVRNSYVAIMHQPVTVCSTM